ncbi:nitroreductase [Deltaproteobacteria bacterium]|nr:nitroreductase [Deltaproteobacteria bacterium]
MLFTKEDGLSLDKIITGRQTTRVWGDGAPPKEMVEAIIEAGRQAPFSGMAVGGMDDFRHFFVLPRGGKTSLALREMVVARMRELVAELTPQLSHNPRLKIALGKWNMQLEKGPRGVGNAPWMVVIAERKGYPASEHQSLSHCIQNMWLKATSLNLAFQLVSHLRNLGDSHPGLNAALGFISGEYAFSACSIGYPGPNYKERATPRSIPRLSVTWPDGDTPE